MELVASLVRSLAWPLALVIIAILFRTQLRGLVGRLESASHRDWKLLFAREVEELSVRVSETPEAMAIEVTDEVGLTDEAEGEELGKSTESPEARSERLREQRIAEVARWRPPKVAEGIAEALADHPAAAVLASWQALEEGLTALATMYGLVPANASFVTVLEALVEAGGIDRTDEETLRMLQRLRARVADTMASPRASTAISYGKVIDKLLHTVSTQLQSAADRFEGAALPPNP